MSSKIILIAVAVFFGVVGKNLSMEDFAAWCKLVHAGECEVVRFTAQFVLFWTRPNHSLIE